MNMSVCAFRAVFLPICLIATVLAVSPAHAGVRDWFSDPMAITADGELSSSLIEDVAKNWEFYHRCAGSENIYAREVIGELWYRGRAPTGTPRNAPRAYFWFRMVQRTNFSSGFHLASNYAKDANEAVFKTPPGTMKTRAARFLASIKAELKPSDVATLELCVAYWSKGFGASGDKYERALDRRGMLGLLHTIGAME